MSLKNPRSFEMPSKKAPERKTIELFCGFSIAIKNIFLEILVLNTKKVVFHGSELEEKFFLSWLNLPLTIVLSNLSCF